ncbi:hypothetical protein KA005_18655 [bacterium]|nr:hypothetical protein [bacterium]
MEAYTLKLDKPRKLKFGFKAHKLLKEQFGEEKSLADVLKTNINEIISRVHIYAWAGLVWEDETLTPEKVEDLIDEAIPDTYTILSITLIITQAIAAHMGAKKKVEKKTKKKTPSLTTVRSRTRSGSPQKKSSKA